MKQHWEKLSSKIDAMTMRERVMVFSAVAFLLVALVNERLINPLLGKQKDMSAKVVQQQEQMKDIQAQIGILLQAQKNDANSPLRQHLNQVKQQLEDGEAFLQSSRENLVQPENMAALLEQVLNANGKLQVIALQTLPATPLIEKAPKPEGKNAVRATDEAEQDKQVFKHGVQITVRGSYPDLLQYLTDLERLPTKMFWGKAEMKVTQYPAAELALTLYTLSLDKTWLQI
jgi:MSHA biogenesis protein MshJ